VYRSWSSYRGSWDLYVRSCASGARLPTPSDKTAAIVDGRREAGRGPRAAATWVRSSRSRESRASCRAVRQPRRAEIHRIPGTPPVCHAPREWQVGPTPAGDRQPTGGVQQVEPAPALIQWQRELGFQYGTPACVTAAMIALLLLLYHYSKSPEKTKNSNYTKLNVRLV